MVESAWLPSMLATTLYLYRLPESDFEAHPDVGGYWTTPGPVASTLEYSGSRLGNASEHPDRFGV